MTVNDQFEVFYNRLVTRRRNPSKPATQIAYRSYFRNWISPEIGNLEVSQVENSTMKRLVAKLVEAELAPASIAGITQLVKGIVSSDIDENGNCRQNRVWNSDFIDAPIMQTLKTPIIDSKAITEAILSAPSEYAVLFATLAGTGLRISECLSVKVGVRPESSYWDPKTTKIVINKALYRGLEQAPKTASGAREVDIPQDLNNYLLEYAKIKQEGDYLFGEGHNPIRIRTAYDIAEKCHVPGYHSFRRFRITHLENVGVPRGLAMYWTGHAKSSVHESYIKLDKDIKARKEWAEKAGLGFILPIKEKAMVAIA